MTTITLAAAAAVTPETMVGANCAMATMGGKDLELRGGLDSSSGPSAYSLRDPRPSTSPSLSFLIRTMGTISPPTVLLGREQCMSLSRHRTWHSMPSGRPEGG